MNEDEEKEVDEKDGCCECKEDKIGDDDFSISASSTKGSVVVGEGEGVLSFIVVFPPPFFSLINLNILTS